MHDTVYKKYLSTSVRTLARVLLMSCGLRITIRPMSVDLDRRQRLLSRSSKANGGWEQKTSLRKEICRERVQPILIEGGQGLAERKRRDGSTQED